MSSSNFPTALSLSIGPCRVQFLCADPEQIGSSRNRLCKARLNNLVKLKLKKTNLSDLDATIQILGKLPNLTILRLLKDSFEGEELHLTLHGEELFQTLTVLQLNKIDALESVEFEEGATPMLELLLFREGDRIRTSLSGLSSLPSLKEFLLEGGYVGQRLAGLREQLARNPNKPVLKRV